MKNTPLIPVSCWKASDRHANELGRATSGQGWPIDSFAPPVAVRDSAMAVTRAGWIRLCADLRQDGLGAVVASHSGDQVA